MKLGKDKEKNLQLQELSDGHSQLKDGLISLLEIDLDKKKNIILKKLAKLKRFQHPSFNKEDKRKLDLFLSKKVADYELTLDYKNNLEKEYNEVFEMLLIKTSYGEYIKLDSDDVEDVKSQIVAQGDRMHYASFENVNLNEFEEDEVEDILYILPKNLIGIKLAEVSYSVDELKFIFELLPKELKVLDLRDIGITTKFDLDINICFQLLPESLHTLCLHNCHFGGRSISEIISMFQLLPRGLKNLDIGAFDYEKASEEEIRQIFAALPESLEVLQIGALYFEKMEKEKISTIIDCLPKNLLTIDLGAGNFASSCTFNQLISLFSNLSDDLQVLIIDDNDLGTLTDDQFLELMSMLPKTLKILNIGNNGLGGFTSDTILKFVKLLPPDLEILELANSDLNDIKFDYLKKIFKYLPESLQKIGLLHNDFGYCTRDMLGLTGDYEVIGVGFELEDLTD